MIVENLRMMMVLAGSGVKIEGTESVRG